MNAARTSAIMPMANIARFAHARRLATRPSGPGRGGSTPRSAAVSIDSPGSWRGLTGCYPRSGNDCGSQQLLGGGRELGASLVFVGVVFPHRLREHLPFLKRRVVEIVVLRASLGVHAGD